MAHEQLVKNKVLLCPGDAWHFLKDTPDNRYDAVVTDPPYELGFMGKDWDRRGIAFDAMFWAEVLRVLKPGGHLTAFGASRNYHRMACAIEDAGFEVRDSLMWIFGTGFPKSHDISKGIDKAAGAVQEVVGTRPNAVPSYRNSAKGDGTKTNDGRDAANWDEYKARSTKNITIASTAAAREWQGFGTSLKPAFEPIVLARKPLSEKTVAANVLRWGTGAINVDGCRVGIREKPKVTNPKRTSNTYGAIESPGGKLLPDSRWPANICHDGSDEVVGMFPMTGPSNVRRSENEDIAQSTWALGRTGITPRGVSDNGGSAARFFYSAKADSNDRIASKHPTVKPIDLMRWLIRLVTPPNGLILDPFAGTGTTAIAALYEGMRCVLVENEKEYQDDIKRRMKLYGMGPDQYAYELAKLKPVDLGPLFSYSNISALDGK
jgi:site-specific DNA-methyltransferase (adenine-specific)